MRPCWLWDERQRLALAAAPESFGEGHVATFSPIHMQCDRIVERSNPFYTLLSAGPPKIIPSSQKTSSSTVLSPPYQSNSIAYEIDSP